MIHDDHNTPGNSTYRNQPIPPDTELGEQAMGELARIMQYGLCHEDVTRKGESQPCGKTAVAVRRDPEDGGPYPVCGYHARGEMVSLSDLLGTG